MKKQKAYWAVTRRKDSLFEGSFNDCWNWFIAEFANLKLTDIVNTGVKIGRIN